MLSFSKLSADHDFHISISMHDMCSFCSHHAQKLRGSNTVFKILSTGQRTNLCMVAETAWTDNAKVLSAFIGATTPPS